MLRKWSVRHGELLMTIDTDGYRYQQTDRRLSSEGKASILLEAASGRLSFGRNNWGDFRNWHV
jgi:hypothetical protein